MGATVSPPGGIPFRGECMSDRVHNHVRGALIRHRPKLTASATVLRDASQRLVAAVHNFTREVDEFYADLQRAIDDDRRIDGAAEPVHHNGHELATHNERVARSR